MLPFNPRKKPQEVGYPVTYVDQEEPAGSTFWNVIEEDKPDPSNKPEEEGYGSPSPELSYEAFMEKQTILNDEWRDTVPDDMIMMRYEIGGAKFVYIGCTALYLLMTISDGDASPISPLRGQIWPLVIIALLAPLEYLVSRQYREVRWHAEDMTAVIYHKGISGSHLASSLLQPNLNEVMNWYSTQKPINGQTMMENTKAPPVTGLRFIGVDNNATPLVAIGMTNANS